MSALMHKGGTRVQRHQLAEIPTPAPTETHYPIPHSTFVDICEAEMRRQNLDIVETKHWINRGGNHYFGLYNLDGNGKTCPTIALRNAHDKMFKASKAMGNRVFVCDNLTLSGEVVIGHKHTINLMSKLPDLIHAGFAKLDAIRHVQEHRFEAYRSSGCHRSYAAEVMLDLIEAGVMASRNANKAWQLYNNDPMEWDGGRHPTYWRLYNAVSTTWPRSASAMLTNLLPRSNKLHQVIDAECNFHPGQVTLELTEDMEIAA